MDDRLHVDCNVRVRALCAETGDVLEEREGHNVWTATGREYSALLKTLKADGETPFREDRVAYVGLGSGTQPEVVDVTQVVEPIDLAGNSTGQWLKPLNHARTSFPDSGSRLAVRYVIRYTRSDLVGDDGTPVYISECGLFTNGNALTFTSGQRDVTTANAALQAPIAYHTFAPIPKTSNIEIELIWELRH
jgi:hypothetical protein